MGNMQLCCLNLLTPHNELGNELANQGRWGALSTTATPDSMQSIYTDLFPFSFFNIAYSEILLGLILGMGLQVRGGNT